MGQGARGVTMDIKGLMGREAGLINAMLQKNNIRAKVDKRHSVCVETGYLSYALTLAMDERFAKVEAMQRELSTVLGNERRRLRLPGDVQVIPVSFPRLALELPHPSPKPLLATNATLTSAAPHAMLAGRSYIEGPQDEYIVFDETPHVLIAGITGAGKSVLLQTMLLSLAVSTSPAECKLVLVDLKNEDLVPFEKLPHTLTFAGTKAAALDALRWVQAEKDKRVANRGYKPYRVVLVIDEMAQIAGSGEAREILGDLASIGRSKDINVIGATQSVTKEGGMGALLKANFTVRLVGQVAPGQSQYATNRPQTHADLLPGKGAFLRCQGPHVYRFQGFYVNEKERGEVSAMARQVARMWGKRHRLAPVTAPVTTGYDQLVAPVTAPVITGYGTGYDQLHTSENDTDAITGYDNRSTIFPIAEGRALTKPEAAAVREMAKTEEFTWRGELSLTKLCIAVYGSKNSDRLQWVRDALQDDGKVIKMRRAANG